MFLKSYYFYDQSNIRIIKQAMFKSCTKRSQSPHSSSQPNLTYNVKPTTPLPPTPYSSKVDLRKFNEYLENRIRQKDLRKGTENSLKQAQKFKRQQHVKEAQKMLQKTYAQRQDCSPRKPELTRTPAVWKRHESIEKLLQREGKIINEESEEMIACEANEASLCLLQRQYQALQQKYKQLMVQAISNAKQYEADKNELYKVKEQQMQNRKVLVELRHQFLSLENLSSAQSSNKNESKSKIKYDQLQSQDSILKGVIPSAQVQKMWRDRQKKEQNKAKIADIGLNKTNQTFQAWSTKIDKSPQYQSSHKDIRNFSAEKLIQSSRKAVRNKKLSEECLYANTQSKASIRQMESMKGSRVRPSVKEVVNIPKELLKPVTVSNLHKKLMSPNLYSKYRFEPSVKLP